MIVAEYDPEELILKVSGHSGYAVRGKDIVCAGVSTLVYTLINSCDCEVYKDIIKVHGSDAVYKAVICGLNMIAKKYPKNIQLVPYRSK